MFIFNTNIVINNNSCKAIKTLIWFNNHSPAVYLVFSEQTVQLAAVMWVGILTELQSFRAQVQEAP